MPIYSFILTTPDANLAYDAVRRASIDSKDDIDYVRDGFVSRSLSEEVSAGARVIERASKTPRPHWPLRCPNLTTINTNRSRAQIMVRWPCLGGAARAARGAHHTKLTSPHPAECWITISCEDVSEKILESFSGEADPLQRANKIRDARQDTAQAAQDSRAPGGVDGEIRCDVVEMCANKSYVLFTYKRLQDVRIVYVPPKS